MHDPQSNTHRFVFVNLVQQYSVYTFSRPDGTVFYVGSSNNLLGRMAAHRSEVLRSRPTTPKAQAIRSIWDAGDDVHVTIVSTHDDQRSAVQAEVALIKAFGIETLTNQAQTAIQIERLRQASVGRRHTEEGRKKIGDANRRRVISDETRAKLRKPKSDEHRRAMREGWERRRTQAS